jgi:hypothetical protein
MTRDRAATPPRGPQANANAQPPRKLYRAIAVTHSVFNPQFSAACYSYLDRSLCNILLSP